MALWKAQVLIRNSFLGGTGSNTWHVRTLGSIGPGPEDADAQLQGLTDILEEFYTAILPILGGGTIVSTEALWTSVDESEAVAIDVDGWSLTASGADQICPPADCIVAGWRTSSPTKGGRGRTFLGPLKTAGVLDGDGTPATGALATVEAAGAALVASSSGFDNGAFGVYSRAGAASPASPGVLRDFTGIRVHNKFGSLRSRRD